MKAKLDASAHPAHHENGYNLKGQEIPTVSFDTQQVEYLPPL